MTTIGVKYILFYYMHDVNCLNTFGIFDSEKEAIESAKKQCKILADVYKLKIKKGNYPNSGIEFDNMKYNIHCGQHYFVITKYLY